MYIYIYIYTYNHNDNNNNNNNNVLDARSRPLPGIPATLSKSSGASWPISVLRFWISEGLTQSES